MWVGLVGGAALALIVVLIVTGWFTRRENPRDSLDPADHTIAIEIENDLGKTVVLKQCDSTCGVVHETDRLELGTALHLNVNNVNLRAWWIVFADDESAVMGCLGLRFDETQHDGLVVPMSTNLETCPSGELPRS